MHKRFNHIYIEITNLCNLKCPFCAPSIRRINTMTLEEINHIANEIAPFTESVYLHIKGEPMLHPEFLKVIEIFNNLGIKVKITTNGTKLNEYGVLLQKLDITRINISLQCLITMNSIERIKYLDNLCDFLNTNNLNVCLRFWNNQESNELNNEIKQYLANRLQIVATFHHNEEILPKVIISIDDEFEWPNTKKTNNEVICRCLGGKTHVGILSSGEVVLCCLDQDGETSFGNVFKLPFESIINQDTFIQTVDYLSNGKPILELCKHCSYRNRFKK